jgi:hypothetical protein
MLFRDSSDVTAQFVAFESLVEVYALQSNSEHLGLIRPLKSRKTFNRSVSVNGDRAEVQMTAEFVGSDGAKFVIDAIMCMTKTDRANQDILTTHTQTFASRYDATPKSTGVRTIISDYINGTPESNVGKISSL